MNLSYELKLNLSYELKLNLSYELKFNLSYELNVTHLYIPTYSYISSYHTTYIYACVCETKWEHARFSLYYFNNNVVDQIIIFMVNMQNARSQSKKHYFLKALIKGISTI